MKALFVVSLLFAVASMASDTNKAATYIGKYDAPFPGPQAYKDTDSGIIFYVESDGRHIAALSPEGKVLWHRDPFTDAKLETYRTKTPRIVMIGKTSRDAEEYFAAKSKKVIRIAFNSSQFGELDIKTGDFTFGGQD